ncbi:hypothetical protein KIN20_024573 [Parelaphostrongylus tenuis]|uniref:Uncharacterized protein n=1 Tax=Parelaphostrongylus tenuis TaxID=148309 RepID=A0AAD5NA34_PARTN|nr:hypothetical protein KIN20_024573 [Parelaphostrongylus tenuis]
MRCDTQIAFESTNHIHARGFVSRRTSFRFFAEFRVGNTNSKDQLSFGRRGEVDREAVTEATEEYPP